MTPRSCSLTILMTPVRMSSTTIADTPRISTCNKTEITNAPFLWWGEGRKVSDPRPCLL
jgi:hypothetical protein